MVGHHGLCDILDLEQKLPVLEIGQSRDDAVKVNVIHRGHVKNIGQILLEQVPQRQKHSFFVEPGGHASRDGQRNQPLACQQRVPMARSLTREGKLGSEHALDVAFDCRG